MTQRLRLSIHNRLLLVALLPAVLITALVATLVLSRGTQALDEAMQQRALAIVSFLAPAAEYEVISANHETLNTLVQAAMSQQEVNAVAIYNDRGALLASNGRFAPLSPGALRRFDQPTVGKGSDEVLSAVAPVMSAGVSIDDFHGYSDAIATPTTENLVGWVYVELDTTALTRRKNNIIGATIGLVLVALALTGFLAVRLARSVSIPVASLVQGVRRMAAGSLDVELPERATNSELAALERGFNTMARAISENHRTMQLRIDEATAQLSYQARHDPLTGLPNRRVFEQALEECVAASRRAGDHGALCFIDLDRFKIVNDTCGHSAGDDLLSRIAGLIRKRVRSRDIVCRVGGDEFALILRGCTREDALRISETLREGISAFRFSWEERRFSVGASIGVVIIDGTLHDASEVLSAADSACYKAKKNGRNQVVAYQPEIDNHEARTSIEPGAALPLSSRTEATLELFTQAIVPLGTHTGSGWYEVLLRLRDKQGELHSAAGYFARSEESSAASHIDILVAERTCEALSALQPVRADSGKISLSLNICRASVLNHKAVLGKLRTFLALRELAPQRVVLELNADLIDELPGECLAFAEGVRALGCRFALQQLDGSGVRHISKFKPDYVKISIKTLIATFGLEAGCNLAQALAGMAFSQGISAIASEVEDPVLLETLHAYGFDLAQGYAIAAPAPINSGCWPKVTNGVDGTHAA